MISKVLLAVKPGHTNASSVKRAKILAAELGFDLLLYCAVYEDQLSRSQFATASAIENLKQSMLNSSQTRLNELKTHFDGLCQTVSIHTCWQTSVVEGILEAAQEFDAELIVLTGSGRGQLGRWFFTQTDWEVIRQAKVPVLVSQEADPKPYAKVIAAVDPTHKHDKLGRLDNKLITVSEQLAKSSQADLYLVHAYPELGSQSMGNYMPPIDEFDSWQQLRNAAMAKLADKHKIESDHTRTIAGPPAQGIVEMAQVLSADLLVMGALSKAHRPNTVLGKVAEDVLHQVDCDLLFVPFDTDQTAP